MGRNISTGLEDLEVEKRKRKIKRTKEMKEHIHLFTPVSEGLPEYDKQVLCLYHPSSPRMDGGLEMGTLKRIDHRNEKFLMSRLNEDGFHKGTKVEYWLDLSKLTTNLRAEELAREAYEEAVKREYNNYFGRVPNIALSLEDFITQNINKL